MEGITASLTSSVLLFGISAVVIIVAGVRLTRTADQLADTTGIGEALFGGVLLGGITSLSGVIATVTASLEGHPEMALSNAIGGIAAQTAFLAIADIVYNKANLEHAAASLQNLLLGGLLLAQLSFILVIMSAPPITSGKILPGIHPASFFLVLIYIAGIYFTAKAKEAPMWRPISTKQTVKDVPQYDHVSKRRQYTIWFYFVLLAIVVGGAGYMIARAGIGIARHSALSEYFVGALFIAVTTSLPELIVSISSVREGALTMAVSNVLGGNTFDVLMVAFADFAYVSYSIYHVVMEQQIFIIALTILMTTILVFGLLYRQRHGPVSMGVESALLLVLYIAGQSLLFFM